MSHMQTHGQLKEWGAKGDRVCSELLAKSLSVDELVCNRPK